MGNVKVIIGENSSTPLHPGLNKGTTHAEMNALKKIKKFIGLGKIKKNKVNLIVLRVNKLGNLCESGPCYHCTKQLLECKEIKINKIYYSRSDESISCVKFKDWIKREHVHISKGFQKRKWNNKK